MKFGQLIFIQIAATKCHILRLKMHQIRFRLGLRHRPRWGSAVSSPSGACGGAAAEIELGAL